MSALLASQAGTVGAAAQQDTTVCGLTTGSSKATDLSKTPGGFDLTLDFGVACKVEQELPPTSLDVSEEPEASANRVFLPIITR